MMRCLGRREMPGWRAWIMLGVMLLGTAGHAAEEPAKHPFRYQAGGRRDPFVPLILNNRVINPNTKTATDASQPVLHGILWDTAGQSIALIDDVEAKVGDTVGEYQVTAIRRDEVVLEADGKSVVLQIAFETQPSGATKGGERP